MKKAVKRVSLIFMAVAVIWLGGILSDRQTLNRELIRLHIVGNSDSVEDQSLKLQVRDAVTQSLQEGMAQICDVEEAKIYLQDNLERIRQVANDTLARAGTEDTASVSLNEEWFARRDYATFSLPAGIYQALRIQIGDAKGENWWCVAFPSLCVPVTAEEFSAVAAGAGFSGPLVGAVTGEEQYRIRFFILDVLGRLENMCAGS